MTTAASNGQSTTQSKWNPLNWFGGGPVPVLGQEAEQLEIRQDSIFLDLPPEMREKILDMLPGVDQKNCRFVCRRMKFDIEQDIGIRARIISVVSDKISWHKSTFVEYFINSASSEEESITDKLEWLKTVRVISLDVNGLNHLPSTIGDYLQSPLSLKTLILRFDENVQGGLQALDILNHCTALNSFQLIYEAPKRFLKWHPTPPNFLCWGEIQAFNLVLSKLLQDILQGLCRVRLKRLRFEAIGEGDIIDTTRSRFTIEPLPLEDYYIGMPPLNQILQIDVPIKLQVLEIHDIQFRDILSPYRLSNQIHLWKAVLDAQTQLMHLSVRIGSIYWRFFEVVLNNCRRSLKFVEIDVCNWHDPDSTLATDPRMDMYLISSDLTMDIPEEHWFDWTVLFSQNCNLESLTIRMPCRAHVPANRTKNFCLNFEKLKKLELHYVKLTPMNLRQVLLELPELKELTLKEWYAASLFEGNFVNYQQLFEQTFNWIRNALELHRLNSIKLFGKLVSGNIYKFDWAFRQSAITNPNYTVKWFQELPRGVYYVPYRQHMENPTLHLLKNT